MTPSRAGSVHAVPVLAILPIIVFVPTIAFYLGLTTSLGIGTAFAAVIIAILSAMAPKSLTAAVLDGGGAGIVTIVLLSAHLLIARLFVPIDFARSIGSFFVLILTLIGGMAAASAFMETSDRALDRTIKLCFWLMCACALLAIVGISPAPPPAGRYYERPIFPFTEPSHFALCFTPLLTYYAVTARPMIRAILLLISLLIFATLQSLTMAAGWALVVLICARGLFLPAAVAGMAWIAILTNDISYYLDRLDITGETNNLSNLIYFQGWELIGESLRDSHWWGIGFQQLGVHGTDVPTSRTIYLLLGDYSNILDGGFTLAKLTSELGVIGIAAGVYLIATGIISAWSLRRLAASRDASKPRLVFMQAIFAGYLVELLLRGTGYFSGTTILLFAAFRMRTSLIGATYLWPGRRARKRLASQA